jgi:hypothetical protein
VVVVVFRGLQEVLFPADDSVLPLLALRMLAVMLTCVVVSGCEERKVQRRCGKTLGTVLAFAAVVLTMFSLVAACLRVRLVAACLRDLAATAYPRL